MDRTGRTKRLGALVALATAGTLVLAAPAGASEPRPVEKKMRRLINAERIERGLTRLRMRPAIVKISRQHSKKLAAEDALYHNDSLFTTKRKPRWRWVGENVGKGRSVESLHKAFMNSQGHKDNVLFREFNRVGVGVARSNGTMWLTISFVGV